MVRWSLTLRLTRLYVYLLSDIMRQLTVKYTIRITETQLQSLKKLQRYDVNVGNFIRQAIKEKQTKNKCPF